MVLLQFGEDPAAIADPADPTHVFAWKLTETRDSFGNRIRYEYLRDQGDDGQWDQLYLKRILYIDVDVPTPDGEGFLVSIDFEYDERPDPFSYYRPGFQVRTTRRCRQIDIRTHAETSQLVRRYHFIYLDQRVASAEDDVSPVTIGDATVRSVPPAALPLNGTSLLSQIRITGHDETQHEPELQRQALPPLEFGYTQFEPDRRDFFSLQGNDLPVISLASPTLELVDLFGNRLPDFVEMNGMVRYWRNLGGGRFDLPRSMNEAPAGLSFADPDVQLIDANGDGRADLLISKRDLSGYFPIRFGGYWDRQSLQRYQLAPTFKADRAAALAEWRVLGAA